MANLLSTTVNGSLLALNNGVTNAYTTASNGRLFLGSNAQNDYSIYTHMEDFGGNYTKLTLDWHTGIKIGASQAYGGIRFYSDSITNSGVRLFSVGEGDANVRVTNNLYIGSSGGWITDLLAAKQNASTAITTGNIGSQSVSFATSAGALTSMNISQFTNNSGYITSGDTTTGIFTTFLGNGTSNIGSGYTRVIRNENGLGGNPNYAPILHIAASDTMWQIAGPHAGQTNLVWRSGYAGTWETPWWTILHTGNYTSFAPSLTGTGASGTWGISITGNANTATTAGSATTAGTAGSAGSVDGLTINNSGAPINPDNVTQNQIGYNTSVSLFGQTDGGLYSSAYSSSWIHQIYGDFRSGQIAIRGKNSGTWGDWRIVVDDRNIASYAVPYGNMTSSTGLNDNKLYLRTNGDNNHYLWNAADDWEELVYFNGTGFRVKGATGTVSATFTDSGISIGTSSTLIRSFDAQGYLRIYGSSTNYLGIGPYNNNGWVYFENIGNSTGTYFNSPGRYAFDSVDVTPYTDNENSLGNGSYRWANIYTGGWLRNYGAQGMYNESYGTHFYSNSAEGFVVTGSGGIVQLQFRSNHQSTLRGYVYADTSNNIGFLNDGGSWSLRMSSTRNAEIFGSDLTIGVGGANATNIIMGDNDEGSRIIHCNSNRIGFLNQSSSWGSWCHDSGAWATDVAMYSPIYYDSANTEYYGDFNGISSMYGVAIRGDQNSTDTSNQIFFWSSGNTTTSAIGFKADGGYFTNPTGYGDGYNTYLTMDSPGRGWVFREGRGGADFTSVYTSGWILNNGVWQANASMRAPIFYDSNNTGYYGDFASTSVMNAIRLGTSTNNGTISGGGDWGIRFANDNGWIQFGPANNSWTHIYSDKNFYFNQDLYVNGTRVVLNSGSWTISVSGSANSLDSGNYISRTGTSGDYNQDFRNTPAGSVRHLGDDANATNNPGGAWWFIDNYRHSNGSSFWGTQVAWGWEDNANRLATRNVISGTFGAWVYYLNSSNFTTYAQEKENQRLSTGSDVTHNSTTSPTFLVNNHSDNTKGYRIHNTSGTSVSAMFTNSSNQLVIAAGAVDQINLNKKVLVNAVALGVNIAPSATAGRIDASNDIVAYSSSDERLKENITPIENALDKVKSLTGVEFDWKPEHKEAHGHEGHDTGIIAQQVEAVMPSAVRTNDTGFLAVRYEKLIGLLIEGMKEQQAQIDELKAKLDGLTK